MSSFGCRNCGGNIRLLAGPAGPSVRCPACGAVNVVPLPDAGPVGDLPVGQAPDESAGLPEPTQIVHIRREARLSPALVGVLVVSGLLLVGSVVYYVYQRNAGQAERARELAAAKERAARKPTPAPQSFFGAPAETPRTVAQATPPPVVVQPAATPAPSPTAAPASPEPTPEASPSPAAASPQPAPPTDPALAARWASLCKQYTERYEQLAGLVADPAMPSAPRAFGRACLLSPSSAALADKLKQVTDKAPALPASADEPDARAARHAHDRAEAELRGERPHEAARLLQTAYTLAPRDLDIVCDLAACWIRCQRSPEAAALLIHAKPLASGVSTQPDQKVLAGRHGALLDRIDPKLATIEAVDQQFLTAARPIRDDAQRSPDSALAAEIARVCDAIGGSASPTVPGEGVAVRPAPSASPSAAPRPTTLNFESRDIDIRIGAGSRLLRTKTTLTLGHDRDDAPPEGKTAFDQMHVTLGRLTFGGDWRATWRLQADPAENEIASISFWPIFESTPGNIVALDVALGAKRWIVHGLSLLDRGGYEYDLAGDNAMARAWEPDGDFSVTFEKKGNRLAAAVGKTKMIELKLSNEQVRRAEKAPMTLIVGRHSHGKGSLKLSVTNFEAGK